jgi:addiction module RelE/StbE family toxin
MKALFHPKFKQAFEKLRANEQVRVEERVIAFTQDPFYPLLRNHMLVGKYKGCRSISAGGDLRLIFKIVSEDTALFITIGTHTQLYDH